MLKFILQAEVAVLVRIKHKLLIISLIILLGACTQNIQKEQVFFSLQFNNNIDGRKLIDEISFSEVSIYYYDREKNHLYGYADNIKFDSRIVSKVYFYKDNKQLNGVFDQGIKDRSLCYKTVTKNGQQLEFDQKICSVEIKECEEKYSINSEKLIDLRKAEDRFIKKGYPTLGFGLSQSGNKIEYRLSYYDDCQYAKQDLLDFLGEHYTLAS